MAFVALTLGVLLALILVLLAIPLTVAFSIHRLEATRGHVRFRWLGGLVRFQLHIPRGAGAGPRSESEPENMPSSRKVRGKQHNTRGIVSLLSQPSFRRRVYRFLRDLLTATHARDLFLRLRIGLGDPADTGCLWAILGPVAGAARNIRGAHLCIEPEFMDPVFELESHGRFRLVPLQFIALTAAFVFSPPIFRAWRVLRRGDT